jgi:hypothetical protein
MKLFVCYGTFRFAPRPGGHPCGAAYHALVDAGHRPDVVRSYGFGMMPDIFNQTPGRKEVKRLTGNNWVPVLVTDSGEAIQGSGKIVEWAQAHPAETATAVGGAGGAGAGTGAGGTSASVAEAGTATGGTGSGVAGGGAGAGGAGEAGRVEAAEVSAAGAMSGGPDTSTRGMPAGEAPADGEAGEAAGEARPSHPSDIAEEPRPPES